MLLLLLLLLVPLLLLLLLPLLLMLLWMLLQLLMPLLLLLLSSLPLLCAASVVALAAGFAAVAAGVIAVTAVVAAIAAIAAAVPAAAAASRPTTRDYRYRGVPGPFVPRLCSLEVYAPFVACSRPCSSSVSGLSFDFQFLFFGVGRDKYTFPDVPAVSLFFWRLGIAELADTSIKSGATRALHRRASFPDSSRMPPSCLFRAVPGCSRFEPLFLRPRIREFAETFIKHGPQAQAVVPGLFPD